MNFELELRLQTKSKLKRTHVLRAQNALVQRESPFQPDATMKDVVLAIRADEAHHRVVNHTLASMKPDDYNPYKPGE